MQNYGNDIDKMLMNQKAMDAVSVASSKSRRSLNKVNTSDVSSDVSSIIDVKSVGKKNTKTLHKSRSISSSSTKSSSKSSKSSKLSDISSDTSSDYSESVVSSVSRGRPMTQDEILNAKKELLYQFDRLERKGVKMPKKFTLASSLEEMKIEYERMKTDREVESSIRFQRQMLMTCVTGIEFLNNKFDPFDVRLDGWSESVSENVNDYDDIFEELYYKYRGKAKMPPELRLLFAIGGSAVMFHFSNTMMKYGFENAMKQNPELVKQFAQATVSSMANNKQSNSGGGGLGGLLGGLGGLGGIGGMLGSLFGGGGGGGASMSQGPPPVAKTQMRGPSNVDDILKELNNSTQQPPQNPPSPRHPQQEVIDRIEVISTISESDLSELPEDASVSGIFPSKKKGKQQSIRRTLDI